jgi:hypothetical protein
MISHAWPVQFQPLLSGLVERIGQANCWFADVDLSNAQIKDLNLFFASSRHGQVCFTLPDGQSVIGRMNPLLGLGSPADPSRHHGRARISFHEVGPLSA